MKCEDCGQPGILVDDRYDGRIVDNDNVTTYADPTEEWLMVSTDGKVRCDDCAQED